MRRWSLAALTQEFDASDSSGRGARLRSVTSGRWPRRPWRSRSRRQTGKTTSARWLVKHYNAGDRFCAIWVDVQDARELSDPARAFELGEAMVSLLTQIRQGYIGREELPFPASIVLVGQRQVRDYALREEDRKALAWLGTTSPFNITAEATTLGPFSEAEVGELVQQHTAVTGQRFSPEAVAKIWALGCGHPWLTNALADQIVRRDVMDRSIEITAEHVEAAKETIILERRTHIDSLVARLREDRVQRVIAPMLTVSRLRPRPVRMAQSTRERQ